ncbi:MAG: UDP-N-acetylmuramoyl-L-alanine--D-glutamate ligase [Chitinophagales bacterium]|nr:UDP-N-acetylmuramoyl-L-alanine--D-glutamate ligase [Bacteroidota bacterium]
MGKRIVILGGGESGVGAAKLAQQKGYDVFLSDKGKLAEKYKVELQLHHIAFEEGMHTEDKILNADEIIKSPGVPDKAAIIQKAIAQNISLTGELEFGYRYCNGTIIAITGTNGKTTTTSLTYHMMKKAGLDVAMGGNIGKSFAGLIAEKSNAYYVLEVSSFQLDDIKTFKPFISVLLNITPDHLDRYDYKYENYIASKFRITLNQNASDYFIYCADDAVINQHLNAFPIHSKQLAFTLQHATDKAAWIKDNNIILQLNNQKTTLMTINELALQGKHNIYNTMAAGIAGHVLQLKKETIRESMMDFTGLEHRLEFVAKIHGMNFINDSKATNVNSTWYALESMTEPVIWIAGGVDKGNDYEMLVSLVKQKVKAIVCMGADNRKLQEAFSKHVDVMMNTTGMDEAVEMAYRLGATGDAVLLSPACASFDLFENYEDRGNQFKLKVRSL